MAGTAVEWSESMVRLLAVTVSIEALLTLRSGFEHVSSGVL